MSERAGFFPEAAIITVLEAGLPADLQVRLGALYREALAVALRPICCPGSEPDAAGA